MRRVAPREVPKVVRDAWPFDPKACDDCPAYCCKRPGMVLFTSVEFHMVAKLLDMRIDKAAAVNQVQPKAVDEVMVYLTKPGPCPFLNKKGKCRIYPARPAQCKGWPWWPGNVKSKKAWNQMRDDMPCKGMLEVKDE